MERRRSPLVLRPYILCTTIKDECLWVTWTITSNDLHECASVQQAFLLAAARTLADKEFVFAESSRSIHFRFLAH